MKIASALCDKYEKRDRRKARRDERRNRRKGRKRRFAEYMDQQLEGKSFATEHEARSFMKKKAKEYVSGIGVIEMFLLQVFIKWLINKLVDYFMNRNKD